MQAAFHLLPDAMSSRCSTRLLLTACVNPPDLDRALINPTQRSHVVRSQAIPPAAEPPAARAQPDRVGWLWAAAAAAAARSLSSASAAALMAARAASSLWMSSRDLPPAHPARPQQQPLGSTLSTLFRPTLQRLHSWGRAPALQLGTGHAVLPCRQGSRLARCKATAGVSMTWREATLEVGGCSP